MKLFGHEFGHHEEQKPAANPAEVAAAEAVATTEVAPAHEASADFQVPTTESETVVTDEAVKEAMGAAANLLDTTEAQANGTMDEVETPAIPVSENKYDTMQPMAAKDAVLADAMKDAPQMHDEVKEATAANELDKAPEAPTNGDNAIIEGLGLPAVGEKTEEDLISSDTSTPSVGAEVDNLNNQSVLAPAELESLPGPIAATDESIVNEMTLPEAGSPESMAILNEADATQVAPAADAEAPAVNEQTPEQQ